MKVNTRQLDAMITTVQAVQNCDKYGTDIEYITGITGGSTETIDADIKTRRTRSGEIEISIYVKSYKLDGINCYHRSMVDDAEIVYPTIGGCKLVLTSDSGDTLYIS